MSNSQKMVYYIWSFKSQDVIRRLIASFNLRELANGAVIIEEGGNQYLKRKYNNLLKYLTSDSRF